MTAKAKTPTANRLGNGDSVISKNETRPHILIKRVDLEVEQMQVRIKGLSILVVHAWSDKAKQMIIDKQTGKASAGRQKRDPVADFKASLYRLPEGEGFAVPAIALKSAAVSAAGDVELKKTNLRRAFHVVGDLLKIESPPVTDPISEEDVQYNEDLAYEHKHGASMRSDMVRIGMGVADIRFRAQFIDWVIPFVVRYNSRVVTAEQLINLFNVAGFGVGLCEHRPEKDGSWGMFAVV
jgi:hypothetical protein